MSNQNTHEELVKLGSRAAIAALLAGQLPKATSATGKHIQKALQSALIGGILGETVSSVAGGDPGTGLAIGALGGLGKHYGSLGARELLARGLGKRVAKDLQASGLSAERATAAFKDSMPVWRAIAGEKYPWTLFGAGMASGAGVAGAGLGAKKLLEDS